MQYAPCTIGYVMASILIVAFSYGN